MREALGGERILGRTVPPARLVFERELERLRRVAKSLKDPRDTQLLEELLDCSRRTADAYKVADMGDPLEPLLLGMILCLARELEHCQGRRE